MTQAESLSPSEFSFASFRLLRDKRLLLKGDEPVLKFSQRFSNDRERW
jgi:hypothetical protein